MTTDLDPRRKKLLYRASYRGFKEADLLIGGFAERHLESLDAGQLDRFEALLEVPEPQLYAWLFAGADAPAPQDNDVLALLRRFKQTYAPS